MAYRREKLSLHLHRTGDIFKESIVVLARWNELNPWLKLKEEILKQGLLQKGARTTEFGILREIRRRYISAAAWLPDAPRLGQFLSKEIPEIAKNQVLFVYTYFADPLVKLVFNKIRDGIPKGLLLRNTVIVNHLALLGSEVEASWSQSSLKKWAVKFKTMLRHAGYLNGNRMVKVYIREEVFAFFLLWLFFKMLSIKESLRHKVFDPLCLTDDDKMHLLKKGMEKDWWYYTEGGGLSEFIPKFKDMDNWINGLEQKGI